LPAFDARAEAAARVPLGSLEGVTIEPEGEALRALHAFLRARDKAGNWCGLQRVVTNDGNILWLCPEHARQHSV
jgi:hypothetical protein